MALTFSHTGFNPYLETSYEIAPSFSPPYRAGTLSNADLASALNTVKMVRYLAGLPYEDVVFSEELNNIAQHGAVLLAVSD